MQLKTGDKCSSQPCVTTMRMQKINTHNDHIELGSVELIIRSFKFYTDGLHFLWRQALVMRTKIVLVDHAFAYIDSYNRFAVGD